MLQGISPRNKLFLIDACESGENDDAVEAQYYTLADSRGIKARTVRGIKPLTRGSAAAPASIKRSYLFEKDRFIYNDLQRRTGAIVFSSSKGNEFSYESDKIGNGYFTKAIMDALTTKNADKNDDNVISTDELREYVSTTVSKMTDGLQNPTVDRDNIYQKFGLPVVGK